MSARAAVSINTRELDRERARRIAEDGLILRGLVGSAVHGLSNPGTDDRDEMGVCIEPPEYIVGLCEFEHYVSRTQTSISRVSRRAAARPARRAHATRT